jgi:hypothetical protein
MFFDPTKDAEELNDESMLLSPSTREQYYISLVVKSLLEILLDNRQRNSYVEIVPALVGTLAAGQNASFLFYFDPFMARFLASLKSSSDDDLKAFLPPFAQMIENSSYNSIPFINETLEFINKRFSEELMNEFLDVIVAFLKATGSAFADWAGPIVIRLVEVLDSYKTLAAEPCRRALQGMSLLCRFANDFRFLVISQICDAIDCEHTVPIVRKHALEALHIVAGQCDIAAFLGPIMRSLCYAMHLHDQVTDCAARSLCQVVCLSVEVRKIADEAPRIRKLLHNKSTLRTKSPSMMELNKLAEKKATSKNLPSMDRIINLLLGDDFGVDRDILPFALTVIAESPSPAIRSCQILASSNRSLALQLFHAAFFSCWLCISKKKQQRIETIFGK